MSATDIGCRQEPADQRAAEGDTGDHRRGGVARGSCKTSDCDTYQYHNSGQPGDTTNQDRQIHDSLSPSRGHDGDTSALLQIMQATRANMPGMIARGTQPGDDGSKALERVRANLPTAAIAVTAFVGS